MRRFGGAVTVVFALGLLALYAFGCAGAKVAQREQAHAQTAAVAEVTPGEDHTSLHVVIPQPETPASVAPLTPLADTVARQRRVPARPAAPPASVDFDHEAKTPGAKAQGEGEAGAAGQQAAEADNSPPWWAWALGGAALLASGLIVYRVLR